MKSLTACAAVKVLMVDDGVEEHSRLVRVRGQEDEVGVDHRSLLPCRWEQS
jgi:hypothetical protein